MYNTIKLSDLMKVFKHLDNCIYNKNSAILIGYLCKDFYYYNKYHELGIVYETNKIKAFKIFKERIKQLKKIIKLNKEKK